MKVSVLFLTLALLLGSTSISYASLSNFIKASSSSGSGGNSSVNVKIENNVNTGTRSFTSTDSQTDSNVEIHQSGSGTSEVTINGKTWKQEGPGDISVQENSSSSALSPSVTSVPSPTPAVLSATSESAPGIKDLIEKLFASLRGIFSKIF